MARKEGKATLRFIMLALYVLLVLCLAESASIIYLYAVLEVDNTMTASLILTFSAVSPDLNVAPLGASLTRHAGSID